MGIEPTIYCLEGSRLIHWATGASTICRVRTCALVRGTDLKSVALDHSAKMVFTDFSCEHKKCLFYLLFEIKLTTAGFEPALPKEPELKSGALDHSANDADGVI